MTVSFEQLYRSVEQHYSLVQRYKFKTSAEKKLKLEVYELSCLDLKTIIVKIFNKNDWNVVHFCIVSVDIVYSIRNICSKYFINKMWKMWLS